MSNYFSEEQELSVTNLQDKGYTICQRFAHAVWLGKNKQHTACVDHVGRVSWMEEYDWTNFKPLNVTFESDIQRERVEYLKNKNYTAFRYGPYKIGMSNSLNITVCTVDENGTLDWLEDEYCRNR